jgi:hypothetical protein
LLHQRLHVLQLCLQLQQQLLVLVLLVLLWNRWARLRQGLLLEPLQQLPLQVLHLLLQLCKLLCWQLMLLWCRRLLSLLLEAFWAAGWHCSAPLAPVLHVLLPREGSLLLVSLATRLLMCKLRLLVLLLVIIFTPLLLLLSLLLLLKLLPLSLLLLVLLLPLCLQMAARPPQWRPASQLLLRLGWVAAAWWRGLQPSALRGLVLKGACQWHLIVAIFT